MAKEFKSSLPKVISKANKDISTIIENDIAKESALLKDLVDEVLKANLEVKKKNNMRITETKRKLAELDEQIDDLNVKIDLVDRETVIEQLNEMIDAENKIFNARQEIRFFDNDNLPERITTLNNIYQELTSSLKENNNTEEQFRDTLLSSNNLLLEKQLEITNQVTDLMNETFIKKQQNIQNALSQLEGLKVNIHTKEQTVNDIYLEQLSAYDNMITSSSTQFTDIDNEEQINEKIKLEHEANLEKIKQENIQIIEKYEAKREELLDTYRKYEASIVNKINKDNELVLQQEKAEKEAIGAKIKDIRFEILNAEKKNDYDKIQQLMKQIEKLEKTSVTKETKKVEKETKEQTSKQRNKTISQLAQLEIKRVTDLNKNDYKNAFEALRYEEAIILSKIKMDHDGMFTDMKAIKDQIKLMKDAIIQKNKMLTEVYNHKLELRLAELEIMKQNEELEITLTNSFEELLNDIKLIEEKRNIILKQTSNNQSILKVNEEYKLKKAIEDIKLDQETNDIDKLILRKRNETMIRNEKLKEELNSEIIYQESLIKIAQKEHELQMIKVKSLYENERSLAEEQVERINLGVKVNDTFVKTTLQNQLLFATQQINCAKSEYDIRVESINLTHDQEVQYANKKIEYYRQKYEYEKNKYRKELEDKLEDLNYKLLLFTDDKDNKEISAKIQTLKEYYEGLIDEVEQVENEDVEIIRYEKVINDAQKRQEQAIIEADQLREQTVSSFQALYDATKEKYDQLEETETTEDTKGIMPLLNNTAISSADERLKQAIKEADELYNERIQDPRRIIQETKAKIEELTNSDETEKFIEEQKLLKKDVLLKHKENLVTIKQERDNLLKPLLDEQAKLSLSIDEIDAPEIEKTEAFRNVSDIKTDYDILIQKEQLQVKELIKSLDLDKVERFSSMDDVIKDTNQVIKKALKPYKKYMRRASRGVNAKKRNLKRDYAKLLRKAINEQEKQNKSITL